MRRLVARWRRDRRGVAAVEFALIAPFMIALYFGLAELTLGMMAERRASHLAATMADLVAQDAQTSPALLTEVMSASRTLMEPFPATAGVLRMRITSIVADANGNVTVDWSRASAGYSPRATGSTVEGLPADLLGASEGLVMAEVTYDHKPIVGYVIDQTMVFSERFYLRPRQSNRVVCNGCG